MISVKNVRFNDYPTSYFPHDIDGFLVEVVLEEGKKRHIRRIFSAMRYHVVDLLRIKE
jgi:16S rRNA U516 pseudouridylate synthase RsuA-like enzyme